MAFLFGCTVWFPAHEFYLKHVICLHKFTERGIHCMASCFISFVLLSASAFLAI